nr:MAG TPA: hypothetical protein [Caudoviricetes sp.]DAJ70885.1 MAG TPA: hypothetical protein [Caudoviricetes sp.]
MIFVFCRGFDSPLCHTLSFYDCILLPLRP